MQLYLDMDGVLADFDKRASEILGMYSYKFEFTHGTDEFWKRLNYVPDLFYSFEPMPDFDHIWGATKHLNPIILTALPKEDPERVRGQKLRWIEKYCGPEVGVYTCYTKDKPNYCNEGDVLVDDRNINEKRWANKGGVFIHHYSAVDSVNQLERLGVL